MELISSFCKPAGHIHLVSPITLTCLPYCTPPSVFKPQSNAHLQPDRSSRHARLPGLASAAENRPGPLSRDHEYCLTPSVSHLPSLEGQLRTVFCRLEICVMELVYTIYYLVHIFARPGAVRRGCLGAVTHIYRDKHQSGPSCPGITELSTAKVTGVPAKDLVLIVTHALNLDRTLVNLMCAAQTPSCRLGRKTTFLATSCFVHVNHGFNLFLHQAVVQLSICSTNERLKPLCRGVIGCGCIRVGFG